MRTAEDQDLQEQLERHGLPTSTQEPLSALSLESLLRHRERFFVRNAEGNWDRVRWHQVGYSHLAYFDDADGHWKIVPGRERLFQELMELMEAEQS